jgi:hypothetical protein
MYPTTNLQFGQSSPEVKKLQEFLISQGMSIPSGPTNYFGNETKAALTEWQKKTGVAAGTDFGYWGPKSIAMAKTAGTTESPATNNPPANNPPANDTTAPSQDLFSFVQTLIDQGVIDKSPEMQAKVNAFLGITGAPGATGPVMSSHYGDTTTDSRVIAGRETPMLTTTNAMVDAAKGAKLVSSDYLKNSISNRPDVMAFYVNALTWGGYTLGDVLNDMKRREMADGGNAEAKKLVIIHPTSNKTNYMNTAAGQAALQMTGSIIPTFNLGGIVDPEILKYGADVPDELFQTLVPLQDVNSQEFKDAVANVKSMFFDLANAQLQATTEQEKTLADYNYQTFKTEIDKNYNIKLSDNATKAWQQIETLEDSFNTRNIAGSGMQNEAIDDYLKTTRLTDQRNRTEKLVSEEAERAKRFMNNATPEEIKALIAEDIAKGVTDPKKQRAYMWGLVPSQEIRDAYSIEKLKERFPEKSDEELQAYHDVVLDENGNYRSSIYRTYYDSLNKNRISELDAATTKILEDAKKKENTAYSDFDGSQPYSQPAGNDSATGPKGPTGNNPDATSQVPPVGTIPDAEFIKKMAEIGITITQKQLDDSRKSGSLAGSGTGTGQAPAGDYPPGDYAPGTVDLPPGSGDGGARTNALGTTANKPPWLSKDGYDTWALQKELVTGGYLSAADLAGGEGVYGPKTTAAVAKRDAELKNNVVTPTNQASGINATSTQPVIKPVVPTATSTASTTQPVIKPIVPANPAQTPKTQYSNLYNYYTGKTGSFNAWNSSQRLADAKKANIANYTGGDQQNKDLLAYLNANQ